MPDPCDTNAHLIEDVGSLDTILLVLPNPVERK